MTRLHIFALTAPLDVTHTNLTRQQGAAPDLPPLANWLGVETIDTDSIELFPIRELGGMALSDYITLAFAPDPGPDGDTIRALNALKGTVLLVPSDALSAPPHPGPEAVPVASLELARADHRADLRKAEVGPVADISSQPVNPMRPYALLALLLGMVMAVILLVIGLLR